MVLGLRRKEERLGRVDTRSWGWEGRRKRFGKVTPGYEVAGGCNKRMGRVNTSSQGLGGMTEMQRGGQHKVLGLGRKGIDVKEGKH